MPTYRSKSDLFRKIGDLCTAFILGAWMVDSHPHWFLPGIIIAIVVGITFDILSWRMRKKEKKNAASKKEQEGAQAENTLKVSNTD